MVYLVHWLLSDSEKRSTTITLLGVDTFFLDAINYFHTNLFKTKSVSNSVCTVRAISIQQNPHTENWIRDCCRQVNASINNDVTVCDHALAKCCVLHLDHLCHLKVTYLENPKS